MLRGRRLTLISNLITCDQNNNIYYNKMTTKQATFEIILGTYEEFLLGYYFIANQSEILQSFAVHDHSSSIRCITHAGNYLASGSADDHIIIYDFKARKEHCMLTHHNSTITALRFTNNHSHILSGSSDGVLAIVRTGNWQLEKIWDKAHKGLAILDIALHSSGKLALTLGSDCSLRTWNLVKGRQAYVINLQSKSKDAKSLEKIVWGPDDVHFILYGGKVVEIWSIETGGLVKSVEQEEKVCSAVWLDQEQIIIGLENGVICKHNIKTNKSKEIKAHDSRVKVIEFYDGFVISGSSTGEIKVWNKDFVEVAKHDTGCRITCLNIVPPTQIKIEKQEKSVEVDLTSPKKKLETKVIIEIEGSDDEMNKEHVVLKKKGKKRKSKEANKSDVKSSKKIKKKKQKT